MGWSSDSESKGTVFDSGSRTLYHDDDPSQDGYTVVATVQSGASVVASDIGFVIS